jgi:hypothetical protein
MFEKLFPIPLSELTIPFVTFTEALIALPNGYQAPRPNFHD